MGAIKGEHGSETCLDGTNDKRKKRRKKWRNREREVQAENVETTPQKKRDPQQGGESLS